MFLAIDTFFLAVLFWLMIFIFLFGLLLSSILIYIRLGKMMKRLR